MSYSFELNDSVSLRQAHIDLVVGTALELYTINKSPVRILDLATGPNDFNPDIVHELDNKGVDYEFVLSDISPTKFQIGYQKLEKRLNPDQMGKIKCVLADATDLRKEITNVCVFESRDTHIGEILVDSEYKFLKTGYNSNMKRVIDFSNQSFDMIIGCIPYTSINTGDYGKAINEAVRVLKTGGYHIIIESQVEKIGSWGLRLKSGVREIRNGPVRQIPSIMGKTLRAIYHANKKEADKIYSCLEDLLTPLNLYYQIYRYNNNSILNNNGNSGERFSDHIFQKGDIVKTMVMKHKKER